MCLAYYTSQQIVNVVYLQQEGAWLWWYSVDSDLFWKQDESPFCGKQNEQQRSSRSDECIVLENPMIESKVSRILHMGDS